MWWQLRFFVVDALLHLRVPCYDSCFLSCFSATQCFGFAWLASCIFSKRWGTVGHWTLILLQGHLEGPGMHDTTLRPFMTQCPGSPSTGDGLIGLDGVMVCLMSWLSSDPMPKASFMEDTSGRCHGLLVSGRAYLDHSPAGQEAELYDQHCV